MYARTDQSLFVHFSYKIVQCHQISQNQSNQCIQGEGGNHPYLSLENNTTNYLKNLPTNGFFCFNSLQVFLKRIKNIG